MRAGLVLGLIVAAGLPVWPVAALRKKHEFIFAAGIGADGNPLAIRRPVVGLYEAKGVVGAQAPRLRGF